MNTTANGIFHALKKAYIDSDEFGLLLKDQNVEILKDFLNNTEAIEKFNRTYYAHGVPNIVLCGMNPGRLGAGKTGIPFTDFKHLSKYIDAVDHGDSERSATFFHEIVEHFGVERFYRHVYVTNLSWLGFKRDGNNVNYDDLSERAIAFIYKMFKKEMHYVKPKYIVSLGDSVYTSLHTLFAHDHSIDITHKLPHPSWCAFPSHFDASKQQYIALFSELMDRKGHICDTR